MEAGETIFVFEGSGPSDGGIELLDDLDYIRDSMVNAATETGATIVGQTVHKFSPTGVTGVVAISARIGFRST